MERTDDAVLQDLPDPMVPEEKVVALENRVKTDWPERTAPRDKSVRSDIKEVEELAACLERQEIQEALALEAKLVRLDRRDRTADQATEARMARPVKWATEERPDQPALEATQERRVEKE